MADHPTAAHVTPAAPPRLLLDEMFSSRIAQELRNRGHDVLAVVADPNLRASSDAEIYAWARAQGRWVVTENVKDFRPLATDGQGGPGLLFTSSRSFPRSRHNLGPLLAALERWLLNSGARPDEDWLLPVDPVPG